MGFYYRVATVEDCTLLAAFNAQLIRDEGHRNPMSVNQLAERMRGWLESGEYTTILFEESNEAVAYAVFCETDREIYLRQFFVIPHWRRQGLGRAAMRALFANVWPRSKRLTVSALVGNAAAIEFWRSVGYADYSLTLEARGGNRQSAGEIPDVSLNSQHGGPRRIKRYDKLVRDRVLDDRIVLRSRIR